MGRHHHSCQPPPRGARGLTQWVRAKLHRRIFVWFGASIVMSGASVWIVLSLASAPYRGWHEDWERFRHFVGSQYAEVWDDPAARDRLARSTSEQLEVQVVLRDAGGAALSRFGHGECRRPRFDAPVERDGAVVGRVEVCAERAQPRPGWLLVLGVVVACGTLWAASGVIARRIVGPLSHVVRVAHDVGTGKLGSRVRIGAQHRIGELAVLADAIDDMAARIEKQLRDQRELLAAVSHEIRTPLGHIRILLETARDGAERGEPLGARTCDDLEREVLEIDDLVGELLASSRLSFDAIERRPLEGLDLGARALERAGLSIDLLESEDESVPFQGDATLLGRALANLLENAKRHGGGVERLIVKHDEDGIVFAVDDLGPGFAADELEKVFDPFYRGERRAGASAGSLGLGLSLVRRIAEAHGGRAWAENRDGRGARVAFRIG